MIHYSTPYYKHKRSRKIIPKIESMEQQSPSNQKQGKTLMTFWIPTYHLSI